MTDQQKGNTDNNQAASRGANDEDFTVNLSARGKRNTNSNAINDDIAQEQQPMLSKVDTNDAEADEIQVKIRELKSLPRLARLRSQFLEVAQLATQPIISMLAYVLVQLINTYFVGNLNNAALLGGVGMGNMLINVLGFAIQQGLNGALETLVSQSFGNKQFEMCGKYLNKGRLICAALTIPLIIIFVFSDKILIALGQDQEISRIARQYVVVLIPGVYAMGQFDATRKFLSSQFEYKIPLITQFVTMILHIFWCWLFITHLGLRQYGAAIATNITYCANMIVSDIWVGRLAQFKESWVPYDRDSLRGWWSYLKIGVPGALMLCFEWWCFELLALLSGILGVDELAAEVVIINIITFIFMVPLGTSYAASALTGCYIGCREIDLAQSYSKLCIAFNTVITIIIIIILGTAQNQIARLFTQEANVVAVIEDCMWVLLIYIFFDTIHGVQSGIIRGLGRQSYGSIYTMFCYYILGLPLAAVFAFKLDMSITGLWLGMTIGCIILDAGFWAIIQCPDWHKIAEDMAAKIKADADRRNQLTQDATPSSVPPTPEQAHYRKNLERSRTYSQPSANELNNIQTNK